MIQITSATHAAAALASAKKLKLMAFDVDGILSEGSLYYGNEHNETKRFFGPDGVGLKMLANAGITLAIITGRKSRCVELRMQDLKIEHVYQGIDNKLATLHELLAKLGLRADEVGYMGDDIVDIQVLAACGFSAAPADCQERVKSYVQLLSSKNGGRGAVREICEFILDARGELDNALGAYLP